MKPSKIFTLNYFVSFIDKVQIELPSSTANVILPLPPTTKLPRANTPKVQIQTAFGHVVDVPSAASPSFHSPGAQPLSTIPPPPPPPTTIPPVQLSVPTTPQTADDQTASTVEVLDPLRAAGTNEIEPVQGIVHTVDSDPNSNANFREIKAVVEKDMHSYGKIVGLAYRNNRLYVPSYQSGNISVLSTPDLKLEAEFRCPNCHIYDVSVTTNGDIIVAEGKSEKIAKIDKNGKFIKDIKVDYSTKGIAVSQYDEIFVLPKSHENIYVYDTKLNELGVIPLPKTGPTDCNFIDYHEDSLYISCETALYSVDVQGKLLKTLKPSKGTYAVGVAVDEQGLVLVGLRGTMAMDVFDKSGKYKETVGEAQDSLWSDIVAGGGYVYVVDYITATIKGYKY